MCHRPYLVFYFFTPHCRAFLNYKKQLLGSYREVECTQAGKILGIAGITTPTEHCFETDYKKPYPYIRHILIKEGRLDFTDKLVHIFISKFPIASFSGKTTFYLIFMFYAYWCRLYSTGNYD